MKTLALSLYQFKLPVVMAITILALKAILTPTLRGNYCIAGKGQRYFHQKCI